MSHAHVPRSVSLAVFCCGFGVLLNSAATAYGFYSLRYTRAAVADAVLLAVPTRLADRDQVNYHPYRNIPAETQVVVEIFGNAECKYCAASKPAIVAAQARYGPAVHWVYRHLLSPTHGTDELLLSGLVGVCLEDRDREWDFFFALGPDDVSRSGIATIVQEITGESMGALRECVESEEVLDRVWRDVFVGSSRGVTGTPTTFVYRDRDLREGVRVDGLLGEAALGSLIESQLARRGE